MTQKIKLVDKDNVSISYCKYILYVQESRGNLNMLKRNMEEIQETQIEFLEIKEIKVWDEKYTR